MGGSAHVASFHAVLEAELGTDCGSVDWSLSTFEELIFIICAGDYTLATVEGVLSTIGILTCAQPFRRHALLGRPVLYNSDSMRTYRHLLQGQLVLSYETCILWLRDVSYLPILLLDQTPTWHILSNSWTIRLTGESLKSLISLLSLKAAITVHLLNSNDFLLDLFGINFAVL